MSQIHDVLRWVVDHVTQDGSVAPEVVTGLLAMVDEHESAETQAAADVPQKTSAKKTEVAADAPAQ
jgi:hypothetical protein